jgi:hypothetical protein
MSDLKFKFDRELVTTCFFSKLQQVETFFIQSMTKLWQPIGQNLGRVLNIRNVRSIEKGH